MLTEPVEIVPGRLRRLWQQVHRRVAARRSALWLTACLAGALFLVPTWRRLDVATLVTGIRSADLRWLLVAVTANFLTLPLMTLQWQLLLPPERSARFPAVWPCVAIGMAGMNTLPAAGGHAVATGLLASGNVTTVTGAVSLLALEQVCEAVAKLVLLGFVIATVPMPASLWRAAWITLITGLVLVAAAAWITSKRRQRRSGGSWRRTWAAHLQSLRDPRRFSFACGLSVLMKIVAWIAIDAVQRSLGLNLPAGSSALVLAAVTFATMVSIAPGNFGFFELGALASYQFLAVPAAQAAVLAILIHLAFLVPIVGGGYVTVLYQAVRPGSPRR